MKRDIELERKILLKIEDVYQAGQEWILDIEIEGYTKPVVAEHCKLLYQQGLIEEYKDARNFREIVLADSGERIQ